MASNKMQEALKQAWAIHNAQVEEQLKLVTEEAKKKRKQPDPPLPVDYLVRKAMKPAFFEWLEIRFDAATQQEEKDPLLQRCKDVKEYIQTNVQVDQQTSEHFTGFRQWLLDQIEYLSGQISSGTMPVLKKGNNDDDTIKDRAKLEAQQPPAPTVSSQSSQSGVTNNPDQTAAKKNQGRRTKQSGTSGASSNGSSSPNGTTKSSPTRSRSPKEIGQELKVLVRYFKRKNLALKDAEPRFPDYCELIKEYYSKWSIQNIKKELDGIPKLLEKCEKNSPEQQMHLHKGKVLKELMKEQIEKDAQAKRTPPKRT